MSKIYSGDIIKMNGTIFENGKVDRGNHPLLFVGSDDEYFYYFPTSSAMDKSSGYSGVRDDYKLTIKYAVEINRKNVLFYRSWKNIAYVNTSRLYKMRNDSLNKDKDLFGKASPLFVHECLLKWFFQQNEVRRKKDEDYDHCCKLFSLSDDLKNDKDYLEMMEFALKNPVEIKNQRDYFDECDVFSDIISMIEDYNESYPNYPFELKGVRNPTLPVEILNNPLNLGKNDRDLYFRQLEWDKKNRPCLPFYKKTRNYVAEELKRRINSIKS